MNHKIFYNGQTYVFNYQVNKPLFIRDLSGRLVDDRGLLNAVIEMISSFG